MNNKDALYFAVFAVLCVWPGYWWGELTKKALCPHPIRDDALPKG